jgi:hypothetical protein
MMHDSMALKLNLATEPFKNRRLWLVAATVVALVGAALSWSFADEASRFGKQSNAVAELVRNQETEIQTLRRQIPPPVRAEQLSVVEREAIRMAGFLIERRLFPWSTLLDDIEKHLGGDTRVTTISVSPAFEARANNANPGRAPVQVAMTIVGKTLDDVLQLIERLQKSGQFVNFQPRKESPLEGTNEVEYEVEATYLPAVKQ